MSNIQKLYSDLSDEKLKLAVEEIKHAEETSIFGDDSIIRNLCRETAKITNIDVSSNLLMVQIGVLKEAAYRWIKTLPSEIKEEPSQAILEFLETFQLWYAVSETEAVRVSLRRMTMEPIHTSNSLHLQEEQYEIDGEIYRFIWTISGDSDDITIEKTKKTY